MFWGFLMLISDGLDLVTAGWFSRALLTPIGVAGLWNGIVELGYTMAGIGATGALIRRVAFTPEKLKGKPQLEGNVILLLILTIVTTSYLVEAHESPSLRWEPIGAWFASILADSPMFEEIVVASYWAHMLAISTFLFLIPVSKHMHLVMAVPNVFFHDTRPMATMLPIDYTTDKGQIGSAQLARARTRRIMSLVRHVGRNGRFGSRRHRSRTSKSRPSEPRPTLN